MPQNSNFYQGQTIRNGNYTVRLIRKVPGKEDEWVVQELVDRGFAGTADSGEKTMTEERLLEIIGDSTAREFRKGLSRRATSANTMIRKPLAPERLAMLKRAHHLASLMPKSS